MADEPPERDQGRDFFISHVKTDRRWAEWIAHTLEAEGFTTVLMEWDFLPGSNFVLEMQRASSRARRTIAILSAQYLQSLFSQPEWAAAFARDPLGNKRLLVPIKVGACSPEGLLPQIVYTDLTNIDAVEARRRLIAMAQDGRAKPVEAPAYPGGASSNKPLEVSFPGTGPAFWNLPFGRNPNFVARGVELEEIEKTVSSAGRPHVLAITGLGGVGKSQLVREYCFRNPDKFRIVWWVRGDEPTQMAIDLADLGHAIGPMSGEALDLRQLSRELSQILGRNGPWLLVFDNAPDFSAIREVVPKVGDGVVIVTSRFQRWRGAAKVIELREFNRDASVGLLQRRSGRSDPAYDKIGEELGDLPLALNQSAAYLEMTGAAGTELVRQLKKWRTKVLRFRDDSSEYPESVATTWLMAVHGMKNKAPDAVQLLRFFACFGPAEIPLAPLTGFPTELPVDLRRIAKDEGRLFEGLGHIKEFSMAERSSDSVAVHRLVQAVLRDEMSSADGRRLHNAALKLVSLSFPNDCDDPRTWATCSVLLPHALYLLEAVPQKWLHRMARVSLLNKLGRYFKARAQFARSEEFHQRALALCKESRPDELGLRASIQSNIGGVLEEVGDMEDAKRAFERALELGRMAFPKDDPEMAIMLNNYANCLKQMGSFDEALDLYEQVESIDSAAFGPDSQRFANVLSNKATLFEEMGRYDEARSLLERSLSIDEKIFGTDHPQVAIRCSNLGSVIQHLGDPSSAKALFERALAIDEKVLGSNHPNVATRLNNLGGAKKDLGDYDGALADYAKAKAIVRDCYGTEHMRFANLLNNEGTVRGIKGQHKEALALLNKGLEITRRLYPDGHPSTARLMNNLAQEYEARDEHEKALPLLEAALRMYTEFHGLSHPNVGLALGNLGLLKQRIGDQMGAKSDIEEALLIYRSRLGPRHPTTKHMARNLRAIDPRSQALNGL